MKQLFLLLAVITASVLLSGAPAAAVSKKIAPVTFKKETYVYVCDSKTAYAYHSRKDCSGLNRCTHGILKVTLSDAINIYKRKPCKICE